MAAKAIVILSLVAVALGANPNIDVCWRREYDRGAGKIPNNCGSEQDDAGLCYKWCDPSYDYYGVGPVCWAYCPDGWTDTGAFCQKGWSSCAKKSHGRGVGTIPNQCQEGYQKQAGLCYQPCKPQYDGDGPICWEANSGSNDYPTLCRVPIAYARNADVCKQFDDALKSAGLDSVLCIGALIESILVGHPTGAQACVDKIEVIFDDFVGTGSCPEPFPPPTSPAPPTTTVPPTTTTTTPPPTTTTIKSVANAPPALFSILDVDGANSWCALRDPPSGQ